MAVKRLLNIRPQYDDGNGALASSYRLFFYAAGSSTKQNTYSSSTGTVANTNPITLNALGEPAVEIWGTVGQTYKIGLAVAGTDDPPASFIWTEDNVAPINDTTVSVDQWVSGPAPTYVSAVSFTLSGDQTSTFHIGRRLKSTNTGGTVYSTITNSAFAALTTVTVVNDSGSLDSGLSAVSYALISNSSNSIPGFVPTDAYVPLASSGTKQINWLPLSNGFSLVNGYLDWTVSGNALTVAIKGWDGNDPSSTNPVYAIVRDATATTGLPKLAKITAANSLAVSSGSTLGTRNGISSRVWAVLFDDAGTYRLGVVNCLTTVAGAGSGSDVTAIYPLAGWGIASSTAEGGAGAADSAQTFYTGTAVSSKAYAVLGYATFESGQATAGTWATAASRKQLWGQGVPLPGQTIQTARSATGAVATGTTAVPWDDTIPQITEGDQYMSVAITPGSAANALKTTARAEVANSNSVQVIVSLHQDAVLNALVSMDIAVQSGSSQPSYAHLDHLMLAATTSATTMRVRAGGTTGATTTFNGSAGGRKLGGVMNSFTDIAEIMG